MKRFFVGAAALAAWAYACDDNPQSHVYVAALFDPVNACFGPSRSLGRINAPGGDLDCAPTCLVTPATGGVSVYVSTMCAPYPTSFDSTQTDPNCAAAIAAWPAEQTALASGTSSCASPPPLSDGGSEAGDAAADADDGSTSADADDGSTTDASGTDETLAVDAADGGADAPAD